MSFYVAQVTKYRRGGGAGISSGKISFLSKIPNPGKIVTSTTSATYINSREMKNPRRFSFSFRLKKSQVTGIACKITNTNNTSNQYCDINAACTSLSFAAE